ncbi:hypothetical protein [Lysobacter gummosus]|uniref:hypothetical protein n=1 Tax=Lysobacter gummosus TaxID=262324 RepID=UPI003640A63A
MFVPFRSCSGAANADRGGPNRGNPNPVGPGKTRARPCAGPAIAARSDAPGDLKRLPVYLPGAGAWRASMPSSMPYLF